MRFKTQIFQSVDLSDRVTKSLLEELKLTYRLLTYYWKTAGTGTDLKEKDSENTVDIQLLSRKHELTFMRDPHMDEKD